MYQIQHNYVKTDASWSYSSHYELWGVVRMRVRMTRFSRQMKLLLLQAVAWLAGCNVLCKDPCSTVPAPWFSCGLYRLLINYS